MASICPNFFTAPSSLGSIYDDPQLRYQNHDLMSALDHHFCPTIDDDNNWHHDHNMQPPPSNNLVDLYYSNGYPNDNIPFSYTPTNLPPALMGGSQQVFPPEAAEMKRRLDHNASERDRRKKINSLYSSLRAVLPNINHKKKLSNPATVTWALKYIPELRKNVQLLLERKQELLTSSASNSAAAKSSYSVQATNLGNGEILVQISTHKSTVLTIPISTVMRELEEQSGLFVIQVSSSQSPAGRVFHHLHLMVEATRQVECELLREKLLCLCQNWDKVTGPALDQLKA